MRRLSSNCLALVFWVLSGAAAAATPADAAADTMARHVLVPVVWQHRMIAQMPLDAEMRADFSALSAWVGAEMNAEMQEAYNAVISTARFHPLDAAARFGVTLDYHAGEAVIALSPDAAAMMRRDISVKSPVISPAESRVAAADYSGFLNIRGGAEYIHSGPAGTGRQPLRIDLDGAVNMKGWVIESRGDYLEDASHAWMRNETRLVRDWPDKMLRAAAGDLSYPVTGFQSYQPMLGLGLARNFSLQPYRVTVPTGETSFVVQTPSTVDIMVGGNRIRTLRVDAGSYDISDFPVTDGANDVTLVITDATGNVEQKTFPLVTDRWLLQKGLHEYTYNAGIASAAAGRRRNYAEDRPVFSLFHRYGVTEDLTAGIAAQGDAEMQQAGVMALKAWPAVTAGVEVFASRMDGYDTDMAAQLSLRRQDARARRDYSAQLRYRGADFAALGQDAPVNASSWEAVARHSRMIFGDIHAGLGGRYRFGRGAAADDWSYSVNFSRSFLPAVTLNLTAEHRRTEGAGVFINLVFAPATSRHRVTAAADSFAGTRDLRWDYRALRDVRDFYAHAGVTQQDGGRWQGTGGASYAGYRGDVTLRHDVTVLPDTDTETRSQMFFGTALAYADGHAALSRPIGGGFVMLARHDNLKGHDVGINPDVAAEDAPASYRAEINAFGPAVLPDATPYMYYPVRVDTRRLPPGYDVGRDLYAVMPSYKSGAVVTVGHAANIFADGYLHDAAGAPLGLRGGTIRAAGAARDTAEFFTNAGGRFRIHRLAAGEYILRLNDTAGHARLTIPQQQRTGRFDAGIVVWQEEEG